MGNTEQDLCVPCQEYYLLHDSQIILYRLESILERGGWRGVERLPDRESDAILFRI